MKEQVKQDYESEENIVGFESSVELPSGVQSFVMTDQDGEVEHKEGRAAEALSQILVLSNQMSHLIADSFGFSETLHTVLVGKRVNTLLMTDGERHGGAIYKSNSKFEPVRKFLEKQIDTDEIS